MRSPIYKLDRSSRIEVLTALQEVCSYKGWRLLAAHIRTNHLHAVVEAEAKPERIMNTFKAYASRRLNKIRPYAKESRRWARHGSTRWLWSKEDVFAALRYVLEEQGEPMEVFIGQIAP